MKGFKPNHYSAKLRQEWSLEPSRSIKRRYKPRSLSLETKEDIYESQFNEEYELIEFDFNEQEKNDEEDMNQVYYNNFLPSLHEPNKILSQPVDAEDLSKLACEVVEKSKQYLRGDCEPSWSKMRAIIISVMFEKNILPSIIPEELEFDITTVKRNSLRYFSASGFALFTCPDGHIWKNHGHCYLDFRMKRICYRYTKRCRACNLFGFPSFPEAAFTKMAKFAAWLYLHRTGTSPKRDAVFFMSRMWHEEPSEHEPEPTEVEIRNIILTAMAEKNVTPLEIPNEKSFDIAVVTMDSLRYFSMKTFAWFECKNEHKWSTIHAWCFIDLKEQRIAYRYELPCPSCRASVKMSLTSESIQNMATKVVERYLTNQRRLMRRYSHGERTPNFDFTTPQNIFKKENCDNAEKGDVPRRTFKSITFKTVTSKTKKQRFIKQLPEPETSEKVIKDIILTKMKENYLIPWDIPQGRKFNIAQASPWSLRYFRTKGFAVLTCNFCKTSEYAVMVCYIDLRDRTICYRFRRSCTLCGNLMETNYSRSSIEKMATYASEQYDFLTE